VTIRRQRIEESSAPCAGRFKTLRIPIGHSIRGFVVPKSNNFATVIPLDILAKLSRKRSQIYWNDINPAWPRRPIQWVFSSQTDFKDDLRILGITPPSQYLLAANYDRSFMNLPDHPDSLLFHQHRQFCPLSYAALSLDCWPYKSHGKEIRSSQSQRKLGDTQKN